MTELWDLYDKNRTALPHTHRRQDPMKPGTYHLVVDVWTVSGDGKILVTLRAPTKEHYPGHWENTGGAALSGETSRQAAVRELREETGIVAAEEELVYLGTHLKASAIVDTYLLRRDAEVTRLTMQEGETVAARWVTMEELEEMAATGTLAFPIGKTLSQFKEALKQSIRL